MSDANMTFGQKIVARLRAFVGSNGCEGCRNPKPIRVQHPWPLRKREDMLTIDDPVVKKEAEGQKTLSQIRADNLREAEKDLQRGGYKKIKSERQAYHLMRKILKRGFKRQYQCANRYNDKMKHAAYMAMLVRPGWYYKVYPGGHIVVYAVPDRRGHYHDGLPGTTKPGE